MTTVFVIDDHPIVGHGVELILDDAEDLTFVGSAASLRAATQALSAPALSAQAPDVVLLDVRLPDADVEQSVRTVCGLAPRARIILFTSDPAHPHIRRAHDAGAVLTLAKDTAPAVLRETIRKVAAGVNVTDAGAPGLLTARQHDVLSRVAVGMTNLEIAAELGIAPTTVKAYWQETMQRLNVRNRAEAIAAAYRKGLL